MGEMAGKTRMAGKTSDTEENKENVNSLGNDIICFA